VVDVPTAKRVLAALARDGSESGASGEPSDWNCADRATDHRDVVDSAASVVTDVEEAAAYVETVGLDRLRRAVERVPDRRTRRRGQRALASFERFRCAATDRDGVTQEKQRVTDGEQFHRGRGTDIRGDRQTGDT
jgi:hypothetical protein